MADELEWVDFPAQPGARVAFYARYDSLAHLRAWLQLNDALQRRAIDEMCQALSTLVADWDICDETGPLPRPAANPHAFLELTLDELICLIKLLTARFEPDAEALTALDEYLWTRGASPPLEWLELLLWREVYRCTPLELEKIIQQYGIRRVIRDLSMLGIQAENQRLEMERSRV